MREHISEARKKNVAGKQLYKCANKPESNLNGLKDYKCPLWSSTINCGSFDMSGYEIDHIIEHCLTQSNNENNLQALCKNCHSVKTKNFMMNYQKKVNVNPEIFKNCSDDEEGNDYNDDNDDDNHNDNNHYSFDEALNILQTKLVLFESNEMKKIFIKTIRDVDLIYDFIHLFCKNKVVLTKNLSLYLFTNNKWTIQDDFNTFMNIFSKLLKIMREIQNIIFLNNLQILSPNMESLMKPLGKIKLIESYETKVKKQKIYYIPDNKFLNKLDENIYLLGFKNGVYDLHNNIFRKGNTKDLISMNTNYDYDPNPKCINEILNIISQIIPDDNKRHYLLKLMSSCLCGEKQSKLFCFVTCNSYPRIYRHNDIMGYGKTFLMYFLLSVLGEYGTLTGYLIDMASKYLNKNKKKKLSKLYHEVMKRKRCIYYGDMCNNDERNYSYDNNFMQKFINETCLMSDTQAKIFAETNYPINNVHCKLIEFNVPFVRYNTSNTNFIISKYHEISLYDKPEYRDSFLKILLDYFIIYKKEGL